ncbi:hypothetical protein Aduo_018246 [Ancylostoma duodenale]
MSAFHIKKTKYNVEWNYDTTLKWMEKCWNELTRVCENTSADYQRYGPEDFPQLEQQISTCVFGITSEYAERALKMDSLLKAFGDRERRFAANLRRRMEEVAGGNTIDVQVVPIYALLEERIGQIDAPTAQIIVFRVRDNAGGWKFIDCALRVYEDFADYLTNNKAPRCMMCYPAGGFLRAQQKQKDENGNVFSFSEIHFGEPPSCTLGARATETLDRISIVAIPLTAVTLFWTPAGWLASGITALSVSNLGYFFFRLLRDIMDKYSHGERCGTEIFHFTTAIAILAANKALPIYLRAVARKNRQLSSWESTIITGILRGMALTTAVDFASLCYHFGRKMGNESKEITPLDVINLVVAAQNMYSCCVSPNTAKAMLEKVKMEAQAEKREKKRKAETSDKEITEKAQEDKKDAKAMFEEVEMDTQTKNGAENAGYWNKENIKEAPENKEEIQRNSIEMREPDSNSTNSKAIWEIKFKKDNENNISKIDFQANYENIEIWKRELQATLQNYMEDPLKAVKDVEGVYEFVKKTLSKFGSTQESAGGKEQEMENVTNPETRDSKRIEEIENKIEIIYQKLDQLSNEAPPKQREFHCNMKASFLF